jgi:hypothetical protein
MNHKRLLSALAKVGATVTDNRASHNHLPNRFKAVGKNGNVVIWYTQPKWDKPEELEATSVHAPDPQTDIMTDLFLDTYFDTIKGVAHELSR